MKKWHKKLLISTLPILMCGSLALFATSCFSDKQNSSNILNSTSFSSRATDISYLYDNKIFSSLDDLCTYYISKNPGIIKSGYYLGDTTKSVLDPSTQMLNINDFKVYDQTKIYPVYLNSLNIPTQSYEDAKKTYVNKGLVSYQYYDFNGNIFDTPEEAKQSIINSKSTSGTLYYENLPISDNKTIDFNPLSSKDLLDFQKLAFIEAASNLEANNKSNFLLKMYDNGMEQELGSLFDDNYIHDMILEGVDGYFKSRLSSLEQTKFNVTLKLNDDDGGRCDYTIKNFSTSDRNRIWMDQKDPETIYFKNLSLNEVKQFNMFINCSEFWRKSWIDYYKWAAYTVAEEAKVHDFLNTYFEIRYVGWDVGFTGGSNADFKILNHGAETDGRSFLSFDVRITVSDNDSLFRSTLEKKLTNNWNKYTFNTNSSKDILRKEIIKQVWNKLYDSDYNYDLFIDETWDGWNSNWQASLTNISNFSNSNIAKNKLLQGKLVKENLITYSNINNNSIYNSIKGINYGDAIVQIKPLDEIIFNDVFSNGDGDFVIEYNDFPLFMFNFKNALKYDDSYEVIKKENGIYKTNLKGTILNIYTKISQNDEIYKNFKNVSQLFTRINGKNKLLDINESLFLKRNPLSKYIKFNENSEMYKEFSDYSELDPELKEFDSSPSTNYKLNSLIPLYNRLIDKLPKDSNYKNDDKFVQPEDIVVLRNKEGESFDFRYKEFLTNGKNIFIDLINNQSIRLVESKKSLQELIQNTSSIEPAKVVVVYDLLGNVINPGVVLSKDEELSTTSDAIFDSSKTVIDNILRTKLVPRDFNNVFYKENDEQYTLVANKINRIYQLNLDGSTYYFPTHFHMMNQLKKYVASFAERVVYNE